MRLRNSFQMAWQTSGMILDRVGLGTLKTSSNMENDDPGVNFIKPFSPKFTDKISFSHNFVCYFDLTLTKYFLIQDYCPQYSGALISASLGENLYKIFGQNGFSKIKSVPDAK